MSEMRVLAGFLQNRVGMNNFRIDQDRLRISVAFFLLWPLFFQLGSGVYRDKTYIADSTATLLWLPLPISILACFCGVVMFWKPKSVSISLKFILVTMALMVCSYFVTSIDHDGVGNTKLVLLAQYILPMFGMMLGQCYESEGMTDSTNLEKGFLYVLAVIVPLQLVSSWLQGHPYLTTHLYLFSIYQHLQYVPVIFVAAFLVVFGRLWKQKEYKVILLVLTPVMTLYAAAAMSMMAIAMLLLGLLCMSIYWFMKFSSKLPIILLLAGMALTWGWVQIPFEKRYSIFENKFSFVVLENGEYKGWASGTLSQLLPKNIKERLRFWEYYAENTVTSPSNFLFGHSEPPDRTQYPSAHNYYLDVIYNFGVLALLPMLWVMYKIISMLYTFRSSVYASAGLTSLSAVVLFLLLVDNSFKVGLRQPYSGIFTFFLLGILITRLSEVSTNGVSMPMIKNTLGK
jgi:hypothetical protein